MIAIGIMVVLGLFLLYLLVPEMPQALAAVIFLCGLCAAVWFFWLLIDTLFAVRHHVGA